MVKRKTGKRVRKRKPSPLEKLQPAESDEVLRALLKAHPKLKAEAEEIARSLISDVSYDGVAGEVAWALEHHDLDELNSRAGKTRWGYVDPTDAAHEILHEAIEPIIAEGFIIRRGNVGLPDGLRCHLSSIAPTRACSLSATIYPVPLRGEPRTRPPRLLH